MAESPGKARRNEDELEETESEREIKKSSAASLIKLN